MDPASFGLPLSVKITRFMYCSHKSSWKGNTSELAREVTIDPTDRHELRTRINRAIAVLKEEGILTAESGYIKKRKDSILLKLT